MQSEVAIVEPMTKAEAEACIVAIKDHMTDASVSLQAARRRALELYQRNGYKALGYKSFKACAQAEFKNSFQHVYRLKTAAIVDENIQALSTGGESLPPIPTQHTRHAVNEDARRGLQLQRLFQAARMKVMMLEAVGVCLLRDALSNRLGVTLGDVAVRHLPLTGVLAAADGDDPARLVEAGHEAQRAYLRERGVL